MEGQIGKGLDIWGFFFVSFCFYFYFFYFFWWGCGGGGIDDDVSSFLRFHFFCAFQKIFFP